MRAALKPLVLGGLVALAGLVSLPRAAAAQPGDLFAPVVRVDDSVVTRFEVDQRLAFLDVLRSPGVTRESVIAELIDDRLKEAAGRRAGVLATPEEVALGMEEFAARANLTAEEFIAAIGTAGVEADTFRAFVRVGVTWRTLVRQRFSAAARVSEAELDRAIGLAAGQGSVRVLLSEIVLPLTPQSAARSREQAAAIGRMTGFAEFERAAREVSVAPSRDRGGRLEWLSLSQLPPAVAPIFLTLAPGEVTPPVPLPGADAIALFQLRDLQDGRPSLSRNVMLDYMLLRLAPGESAGAMAARLREQIGGGGCAMMYGAFPGADESRLARIEAERAATQAGVAGVLDRLDPGELAALPDNRGVVMLCERSPVLAEDLSRDDLRQRLFASKLEDLGDALLAELRANAFIERP